MLRACGRPSLPRASRRDRAAFARAAVALSLIGNLGDRRGDRVRTSSIRPDGASLLRRLLTRRPRPPETRPAPRPAAKHQHNGIDAVVPGAHPQCVASTRSRTGTRSSRVRSRGATLGTTLALLVIPDAALAAPPPNDDFDDAVPVTALPFTAAQDVTGATRAEDDPSPHRSTCDPLLGSVWYAYTAAEAGWVAVNTAGSDYQTVVSVWQGSRGSLSIVTCRGSISFHEPARARFLAAAGETYYVAIAWGFSFPGANLALRMHAAPFPPNDDFDDATVVPRLPFVDELDATDATPAADDPLICGGPARIATVWYTFTPVTTTMLDATVGAARAVSAWTGTRGALNLVACSETPFGQRRPGIRFTANAGTTYYFMVDTYAGISPGLVVFTLPRKSSLTVRLPGKPVAYGTRVTVAAHLGAHATAANTVVSLYMGIRKKETLLKSGPVGPDGALRVSLRAVRNARFFARWEGGGGWLPAESKLARLQVKTIVRSTVAGYHGRAGAYFLYRPGSQVKQTCFVAPSHAGRKVVFVAQHQVAGRWTRFAMAGFKLSRTSSATAFLSAPANRYRVRCVMPGHWDHARGDSPWRYVAIGR